MALVGIVGADFSSEHLAMLERNGVVLDGVERSAHESFTWTGEYHTNMNERTTHKVGLNVLENWEVKIPESMQPPFPPPPVRPPALSTVFMQKANS